MYPRGGGGILFIFEEKNWNFVVVFIFREGKGAVLPLPQLAMSQIVKMQNCCTIYQLPLCL